MIGFEQLRFGIGHDPCCTGDRLPIGAIPCGAGLHVRLRVDASVRHEVQKVCVHIGERDAHAQGIEWRESELVPGDEGFFGSFEFQREPHVVWYAFELQLSDGVVYYVPCADGRSTAGELVRPDVDGAWGEGGWRYYEERLDSRPRGDLGLADPSPGFQVTVYDPAFSTPDWLEGAVMYQIFPDRFARGEGGMRAEGIAYHESMGRPMHLHEKWDEPVDFTGIAGQIGNDGFDMLVATGDSPDCRSARGDGPGEVDMTELLAAYDPVDFYGGTLAGIREKLPYLASLGVEVVYLNPVFEARSNHRYDTADYERIEPLLGTEEDFRDLVEEAAEWGISFVLDAVLSHTGSDSRYFNAVGSYDSLGAAQGASSPYYSWYDFDSSEPGAPYRCWWGDPTLPEVNERDESWQSYILGQESSCNEQGTKADHAAGGVLGKWLSAGARGYRLDVADEIPDDVLERIRSCVKDANPDAVIIGEVWEDATTKTSYGAHRTYALGSALDSVMNYPLRGALIGFALGWVDALQLATFLKLQQANYPQPMCRCLMNLLSTHDVERVRSILALSGPIKHLPRNEQLVAVRGITAEQDARADQLQRLIVGLLYSLPGMPCLYYGDEQALHGGGDPFCRATFPWGEGAEIYGYYQELGLLRKRSAALRNGAFACFAPSPDVVCVVRAVPESGEAVVVVANRGEEERRFAIDFDGDPQGSELCTAFDKLSLSGLGAPFDSYEKGTLRVSAPGGVTTYYVA